MKWSAAVVMLVAGCSGAGTSGDPDGGGGGDDDPATDAEVAPLADAPAGADLDGDGLADADEERWARDYRPFLSVVDNDDCPLGGIVTRVYPHPADPTLVAIVYDHLFERDCGLGGHVGDNEVFGATIDPAQPAPAGLIALKSASHQGTPCQVISECGRCPGQTACDTTLVAGVATPVVYTSRDKHATYVRLSTCGGLCFDSCALATTSDAPPMVDAGEPTGQRVNDLTAQGFITAANGWTEPSVFGFDPWGATDFGGAGNVADDLVDPTFVAAACQ